MHAFISAKFTCEKIGTHLKYVLPFPAMDEAPTYVTGHLILPKIQYNRFPVTNEVFYCK